MSRFIGKLALFVLLQAGLFYACSTVSESRKTLPAIALATEDRLAPFVREMTLPVWNAQPGVIASALADPPGNDLVNVLARGYNNGPNNYMCAARDKFQRLKSTPGERVILVGGSNLAFGMDSEVLEDRYKTPVVNLGLLARLGVNFMTRQVADHVREGDIVIFSMEYSSLCNESECDLENRAKFCHLCPELAGYFEPGVDNVAERGLMKRFAEAKYYADRMALSKFSREVETMASRLLQMDSQGLETAGSSEGPVVQTAAADPADHLEQDRRQEFDRQVSLLTVAVQKRVDEIDQLYVRSEFNPQGDLVGHWAAEYPLPDRISAIERQASNHKLGPEEKKRLLKNLNILNACAAHCREAGATVYFAPTPLLRSSKTEQFAKDFEKFFVNVVEIPLLIPVAHCLFERENFYDSVNHLNGRGIRSRMQLWMTALDQELTPQVTLSPAEHVAAHWRTQSHGKDIAAQPRSPAVQTH